jgi:hypothetical protein
MQDPIHKAISRVIITEFHPRLEVTIDRRLTAGHEISQLPGMKEDKRITPPDPASDPSNLNMSASWTNESAAFVQHALELDM